MGYKAPKINRIYHIYGRGNRRCKIGKALKDYDFLFQLVLKILNVRDYELLCFCLMPNHYHILASQTGERTLSRAMHIICSAYTKYYNQKYAVTGHLFQGTYKRKWIIGDDALVLTYAYVINNSNKLAPRFPTGYPWVYQNDFLLKYTLTRRVLNREQF